MNDQLLDLTQSYLDGDLQGDDLRELERLLSDDAGALEWFAATCRLECCLHDTLSEGHLSARFEAAAAIAAISPIRANVPLSRSWNWFSMLASAIRRDAHPVRFYATVTVLTLGFLSILGVWISPRTGGEKGSVHAGNQHHVVAKVIGNFRTVEAPSSAPAFVGAHLLDGQTVHLTSGVAEFEFKSGARVVLEGPAILTLRDKNACHLESGRLVGKVPAKAHGFSVATPVGTVIDRGTEFGLHIVPDGSGYVGVFAGLVDVSLVSDVSASSQTMQLRAGQALRLTRSNGAERVALNETGHFTRTLPNSDTDQTSPDEYAKRVLAMRPIAYYRFEARQDRRVVDSASLASDGKQFGYTTRYARGRVGTAIQFAGAKYEDYALVPDYPQSQTGSLSVAAWVCSDSHPSWAVIAANWGETRFGQFYFGIQGNTHDLAAHVGQPSRGFAMVGEGAGKPFALGVWQHVAFVADGKQITLYRGGEQVAISPCEKVLTAPPMASLGIGLKTDNSGKAPSVGSPGYWHGRIDELALFDRALTEEQIKTLVTTRSTPEATLPDVDRATIEATKQE